MIVFLTVINVILTVVIIVMVLLQQGKQWKPKLLVIALEKKRGQAQEPRQRKGEGKHGFAVRNPFEKVP